MSGQQFYQPQDEIIKTLCDNCETFDEFKGELKKYYPTFDEIKIKKYYWDKK